MGDIVIKIQNLNKSFHLGQQEVQILKGISFDVRNNDFLVIFGPSGCGKSTLLHTILGLEEPTSGEVIFLEQDLYKNTIEDDRSEFRKNHIGMVYQQSNWIKALTVAENVAFPLSLKGTSKAEGSKTADEILRAVGMNAWASHIPTELSSGQQQKVALARALITNPEVIIADEPTGNLDFESGQELMELLVKLNQEQEKTILMVTHDLEYLKFAKNVVRMFNGTITGIYGEEDKDKLLKEVHGKRGNGTLN